MEGKQFHSGIPFGDRSTKHYSNVGEAPNIHESNLANLAINRTLSTFVRALETTSKEWNPAPLSEYDRYAAMANPDHPHMPKSVHEIVPIPDSRGADSIISGLAERNNLLIQNLLALHTAYREQGVSDLVAARETMQLLAENFDNVFVTSDKVTESRIEDLYEIVINGGSLPYAEIISNVDSSRGFLVTPELRDGLVLYQSLQERFNSKSQVEAVNTFFEKRQDVLEAVLGIQLELCQQIREHIQKVPGAAEMKVAFAEVALVNSETGEVTPSPRLLKIIAHNWGRYFTETPDGSASEILSRAIPRAIEDEIYMQYIFVFRTQANKLRLHGIVPKLCPARTLVGRMIAHYISSDSSTTEQKPANNLT